MFEKNCLIIGAGEFDGYIYPVNYDLTIAADGGYKYIKELGIKPDIVVGDFDSLGFCPSGEKIVKHPVMKDETDTMLAVDIGLSKGYKTFFIYGGCGGRFDHTLANIQTLSFLANNGSIGFLVGNHETMTVIKNNSLSFSDSFSGNVSVFSLTESSNGVCESGLLYRLDNAILSSDIPLGVSNSFKGEPSIISIENGLLLIIWEYRGLPR